MISEADAAVGPVELSLSMRRDEVIAILKAAMPDLRQRFGITSILLFGSVARGDAGPESDVDVVADFQGGATFTSYFGLVHELERLLNSKVDIVTAASVKPRLAHEIAREGIRVA